MEIELYSTPGCKWCEKSHKLFDLAEVEYKEYVVGTDISAEDVKIKYPFSSGYPVIVIDGKNVGGLVGAAKEFVKRGIISAPK